MRLSWCILLTESFSLESCHFEQGVNVQCTPNSVKLSILDDHLDPSCQKVIDNFDTHRVSYQLEYTVLMTARSMFNLMLDRVEYGMAQRWKKSLPTLKIGKI